MGIYNLDNFMDIVYLNRRRWNLPNNIYYMCLHIYGFHNAPAISMTGTFGRTLCRLINLGKNILVKHGNSN